MRYHVLAQTWWGKAWIEAFTDLVEDPGQLVQGRAYARGDHVRDLNIEPGFIDALVQGSSTSFRPYAVTITVPTIGDAGWGRLLDAAATQAGHLAEILSGEIPPALGSKVDLVPRPGELRVACSCPDPARLCKHGAAVCYLTAEMLDADPFVLFLLRGRTKAEVLSDLRGRRPPAWSSPSGMLAREAYSRELAPPPVPALPPPQPGRPARLPAEPPAASGVTAQELAALAAVAAQRAWQLLRL